MQFYEEAKKHGKIIIISKDADLPELITRLGAPPKLINLKIGNCDNRVLWNFIHSRIYDAVNALQNPDVNIIDLEP